MEGSNVVIQAKKLKDGTVREYRICRECRNAAQRKYQSKRNAERRAAAAHARELAARQAAYDAEHCSHCRNEPRAIDLAYIASLSRVIDELGGTVPRGPEG